MDGGGEDRPLVVEQVGEDTVVAWPMLLRERVGRRVRTSDRYRIWVLWSVLAGLFAAGFTITIVAVSLDDIAGDLDSSATSLTWVVTGPLLVFALFMPMFGKFGDVYGHRRVYLLGYAGFTIGAVLTALAWDGGSLVAFRVLAAIPGAAVGPTSMALIMRAYPDDERVKAMGWWALVGAGAPVIGLVAGGPVVDAFGWRWIFIAQAPVSAVALIVGFFVLQETPRTDREPIDFAGAGALAAATVSPLLALTLGETTSWTSPIVVALFALTPGFVLAFVTAERRAAHPLLPLELLRRRNVSASLLAQFASNFAYMGGFIVTPSLLGSVFGFSVAQRSLAMTPRPLSFSLSAPVSGYAAVRIGERRAAVFGCVCVVGSMGLFAVAAGAEVLALVFVALVLSGIGLGSSMPSLTTVLANEVESERLGVANAAQQMVAQIGVVTGIQVLSVVQGAVGGARGYVVAYVLGGGIAVFGVVGAVLVRDGRQRTALRVADAA
jgi:EmrB/QacA subfamily drug resistance transporter